jgi:PAS domain S-box-containing protein
VSDQTFRPTVEEHLGRLSVMAEEMRGQLVEVQDQLVRSGKSLPTGLLPGLRQLSGSLTLLQQSVEERELERRNLIALAEMSGVVNSSLDLATVLNEVIDTIIRLTGAGRAFLMLKTDMDELDMVVARNWERESLDPDEHEVSRTIIQRVLRTGDPVLTTNASADPRFDSQESIVAYNLRSILCVPLKVKGSLTGVIYADNKIKEGLFTERERSLLSAFSHQAAVALDNARLFDSVRRSLDEVTDLKNLMEDVFASIASGVLTTDVDNSITLANRAAAEILSRPEDQIVGSPLDELLGEASRALLQGVDQVRQTEQRVLGLELETTSSSRGPIQLSLNLTPLKKADRETRGVAIVIDDLTEKRRLEGQRRLFERMVSPAVIDQLDPDQLKLGGQRAVITTLFADLRGYTAFSHSVDPEALVGVLNDHLSVAAEALLEQEATIDKFLGDAVMAWFNAPIEQPDHVQRAVRAALSLRNKVSELHAGLAKKFRLSFGVGIHTGEALLGLVGSNKRLDYTAIGDSVNVAKRLQESARPGAILVSEQVAGSLHGGFELRPLEPFQVEGLAEPLQAYELLGEASSKSSG